MRTPENVPLSPWAGALGPAGLACFVPWATGPDPHLDGVVRLAVARLAADGSWEGLEFATRPFVVGPEPSVHARLRATFGVEPRALDQAPPAVDVWPALREFIGERVVLAPDGDLASAWARALDEACEASPGEHDGHAPPPLTILGLAEVALLLHPGRLALRRDGLIRALLPSEAAPAPPGAVLPPHVLCALQDLVARFQGRGPTAHALAVRGWTNAAETFAATDPDAALRLRIVLELVDRPGRWATGFGPLVAPGPARRDGAPGVLADGLLTRALSTQLGDDDPLAVLDPAWTRDTHHDDAQLDDPPLAPDREAPTPFAPEDLRVLDEVFREHLPTMFGTSGSYRQSQHRIAESIASALGDDAFLLVHAPTGTGKTLAYLLPALLFARRHELRVGVATYTRALQEQAMDREVPRALAALGRAGAAPGFRVTTLKGREHSLCWRALRATTPVSHEEPETWLAWTALALFALSDVDGDLDRFPHQPPVRLRSEHPWRARLGALLRQVRARAGCCTHVEDRQRCAAEVSRRRAERSHVVITNQSFALARTEFFRRIVFDECEHLHDQAGNAFSTRYTLSDALEAVGRLSLPGARAGKRSSKPSGERGGGALERLAHALPLGTSIRGHVEGAEAEARQLLLALARLERELEAFEEWRTARLGALDPRHEHALFRLYAEGSAGADAWQAGIGADDPSEPFDALDLRREDDVIDVHAERTLGGGAFDPSAPATEASEARGLVFARDRVAASAGRLDAWLASIGDALATANLRRIGRIRRALDLGRQDLVELGEALGAWLPVDEGRPRFTREYFHDVERDARGELVLTARVLLPDRLLGREVLPKFAAAVFVSATTKLAGSFDTARRYLGLDQLAAPSPSEHEPRPDGDPGFALQPREVRAVSAPEVFDYSRVLVAAALDLPPPQRERAAWLARIAAWLPTLAERTGGRILGLFTSLDDVRALAEQMAPEFRARSLPLYWQGMDGAGKEELAELFRERVEATLLGVDTFWYGADFPGDTLEVLLLARLPFGVPDRFHFAQCAALGEAAQRQRIYMPRALSKFRQGFGRLMRRASDRGVVISLDARLAERRHAAFLRELPLARIGVPGGERRARYVQGTLAEVTDATLTHLGRQLARAPRAAEGRAPERPPPPGPLEIDLGELPF